MKKVLLALVALVASAVLSNAQIAPGRGMNRSAEVTALNTQYADLLSYQNHLLKNRKTAMIVTLSGLGVCVTSGVLGASVAQYEYSSGKVVSVDYPVAAAVGVIVGECALLTGGIWMIVNEFKMVNSQRKINDHLILRYGPNGVALQF